MEKSHELMGGAVQLFRRPNSKFWYAQATVKNKQRRLSIASFYLRAVCMNRNLWCVQDFQEISIRHSKFAAQRFAHKAVPALKSFAQSSPAPLSAEPY